MAKLSIVDLQTLPIDAPITLCFSKVTHYVVVSAIFKGLSTNAELRPIVTYIDRLTGELDYVLLHALGLQYFIQLDEVTP